MMVDGVAVFSGSLITTPFLLLAALGAVVIVGAAVSTAVMVAATVTTFVISLAVVTTSTTSLSSAGSGSSFYMLKTLSACSRVTSSYASILAIISPCLDTSSITSGVEDLIPIPSEFEGIPDHMCDFPSIDNSPPLDVSKDQIEDFSESNKEFSSTDDDSFYFDNIDYVEASPLDSELDSSEVDAFLAVEDEFTSSQFPKSCLDPEGDMLLFEAFLDDDHSFDFKTKSTSTSLNSLLEETNNINNSLPEFTTFSNVLYDAEYESDSSDDQSCFDEDVLVTIILKPLSEEEIIPMKSLRTHDSSLPISSKINSFLDEFAVLPGIEDKDYDSERDILVPKDLPSNNSLSFAEKESFHFDIPLFSRPSAKPPD
nr:hypothetical protein [Tanacetum cinerariifolium]